MRHAVNDTWMSTGMVPGTPYSHSEDECNIETRRYTNFVLSTRVGLYVHPFA